MYPRRSGCPACHAEMNPQGKYRGGDPTINRLSTGHPSTHRLTARITNDTCRSCHNRSARTGMNYQGEMESTQYGTPYESGNLSSNIVEDRFYWKLLPDIHHEKGLACIDCHTSQDTMGDGKLHVFMKDQIEIRCEDCHGNFSTTPAIIVVTENNLLVQSLIKANNLKVREGDLILQTSRGRPLANVALTEKGYSLIGKISGKSHPVSVITAKKGPHSIKGHERLECDTCHSAWSPQCYGCHQLLDLKEQGIDHLSGKTTSGRWSEGRNYFRYERNILGINPRGKIGILVPGCQVFNSVLDSGGNIIKGYDSRIMSLRNGMSSIAVGATHPHTTRKESARCIDCHLDPKSIGLGEGTLNQSKSSIDSIYQSSNQMQISYPLDQFVTIKGEQLQGTSHDRARGFNQDEITKILAIGPCLPCHDKYDDPIWQKPGPYKMAPACEKALDQFTKQ